MVWQGHLKHEIKMEIKKQGRGSLVDLSDSLGVDLYHVERQSKKVVSDDPTLMLINGEIMSQSYWDSVTEEINEKLQERSQIAVAEIAAQLHIGSELVINILEPRLGTIVCFSSISYSSSKFIAVRYFKFSNFDATCYFNNNKLVD
jgi:E3 UFM1-protein ligase 1